MWQLQNCIMNHHVRIESWSWVQFGPENGHAITKIAPCENLMALWLLNQAILPPHLNQSWLWASALLLRHSQCYLHATNANTLFWVPFWKLDQDPEAMQQLQSKFWQPHKNVEVNILECVSLGELTNIRIRSPRRQATTNVSRILGYSLGRIMCDRNFEPAQSKHPHPLSIVHLAGSSIIGFHKLGICICTCHAYLSVRGRVALRPHVSTSNSHHSKRAACCRNQSRLWLKPFFF